MARGTAPGGVRVAMTANPAAVTAGRHDLLARHVVLLSAMIDAVMTGNAIAVRARTAIGPGAAIVATIDGMEARASRAVRLGETASE